MNREKSDQFSSLENSQLKESNRGIALTTFASLLWGTVFIGIGIGLEYIDPYDLLFMRFLVSALPIVILGFFFEQKYLIFSQLKRPALWLLAAIYLFGFIFQYAGQSMTNASDTTLISNMAPIIAPIGAYFLLKEKIRTAQIIALALGVLGLIFIALPRFSSGSSSALGYVMLFVTSISYAAFIIAGKRYGNGTVGESFAVILAMTILSVPIPFFERFNPFALNLSVVAWASILWVSIPCTLVAVALYLLGLNRVSVTVSSMLLLLQVIFGLVLAKIILSESLSYYEAIGALLIFVSVLLASITINSKIIRKAEGHNIRGKEIKN